MIRMRGIPTEEMMEQRFVGVTTEPSFDSMDPRISQGRKVWCFLEFLMAMVRLVIGLLAMHETCCPPISPRLSKSSSGHHMSKMGFLKLSDFDRDLGFDSSIDCFCSGTTAMSIIKQGEHLVVANVGDSRAVLCTRGDNHQHIPIQLTADQKPNVPSEAERIKKCQGRITADKEEPDIYRVWVPDADYPGLAMSRSFGDFCLKDYGLIPTPEVATNSQIWDVLTNKQVINIVASAKNRSMAAKLVVKLAAREWKRRFIGLTIDDCTVICLFFKNPPLLSKSMTNVGRRSMRSHPELSFSRSCRSMGIDRKIGEEEGESVNRESKEDRKGVKGLNRSNSVMGISRTTRSLSHNHKAPKFFHEVEARESGPAMA